MGLMLLFLLVFAIVGFVMLGLFPDTWAILGERLLGQGYFGWQVSHGQSSRVPQQLGLFLYSIDGTMVFFGVLTLFGLFMAGFSLVKVGEFSRSRAELESLHQMLGLWNAKARRAAGLLAASLFKSTPRRLGLTWKMGGTLAAILFLIGLLILGTVYRLVTTVIQAQVKTRAVETAKDVSDGAARHLTKKDPLALHALLMKYGRLDGVAYVFVEDGKGRVIMDRLGSFPIELQEMLATDAFRTADWRRVSLRGEAIYDVRVPIVDGEMGAAHVGIRKDSVDKQIHAALFPVVTLIAMVLVGGIVMVFFFVSRLSRPILHLTEVARQMSNGDLDTPTAVNSRDEVADLALSFERMRSSLKAAMSRLDRDPPSTE